jgi:toxin CptA
MPSAATWVRASPECRLTWRPSRWVVAVLVALGPLGALAIWAADVPDVFRVPLGACACLVAMAGALREHRRPPRVFIIRSDASASLDDMPIPHHHIHWRGTLAFLRARDIEGRVHRLAFWPDTLSAQGRRALRLASPSADRLAAVAREMRG